MLKKISSLFLVALMLISLISAYTVQVSAATTYLSKSKLTLKVGKKATLKLNNSNGTIKWVSSNTKIATVNSKGLVTAKKAGKATITATNNSKIYKCTVTVKNVKVSKISISKKNLTLKEGKTAVLKCTLKPRNVTNKKIKWKTSNKKVAVVSKTGKVTAKNSGLCTITASTTDGSKLFAICSVRVENAKTNKKLCNNLNELKDYIVNDGAYNQAGNKFIYEADGDYSYSVSYLPDEDSFYFIWFDDAYEYDITVSVTFKLCLTGYDYCTAELVNVYDDGYYMASYSADIVVKTSTYNMYDTAPDIVITSNTYGFTNSQLKEYITTDFEFAMLCWDELLSDTVGMNLTDIGFNSY